VIERPELASDVRYATNGARVEHREELVTLLEGIFRTQPAEVWVERCRTASIPASLVQGVLEALRSEPARPLIGTMEHPDVGAYQTVRHPVRFDGERLPLGSPPPRLGEHTEEIIRDLNTTARTAPGNRETRR
jgi:crotonobetainyl-CoA:carnitine CoA-transferase CaiB-like acyl-CoA transferase